MDLKGLDLPVEAFPLKLLSQAMASRTIRKSVVYHVGRLSKRLERSKGPRAGRSLEGAGLSVSDVPTAWRRIARLGGLPLYATERADGRDGEFIDLTGDKVLPYAAQAERDGWVTRSNVFRVWTTDEEGEEQYMEFDRLVDARREAESYDEARVERVDGYAPTDKLLARWRKDFTGRLGTLSILILNIAVLYMLDETSAADGAWWSEELDVSRLSAPRGVIFPSKLPRWQAIEIPWSQAPDIQ